MTRECECLLLRYGSCRGCGCWKLHDSVTQRMEMKQRRSLHLAFNTRSTSGNGISEIQKQQKTSGISITEHRLIDLYNMFSLFAFTNFVFLNLTFSLVCRLALIFETKQQKTKALARQNRQFCCTAQSEWHARHYFAGKFAKFRLLTVFVPKSNIPVPIEVKCKSTKHEVFAVSSAKFPLSQE